MAKISASVGQAVGTATATAVAALRVNMAIPHLIGAARFSRIVAVNERDNGLTFGEWWEEMREDAMACVFMLSAAIEAYTNEVYADRARHFSESEAESLERTWDVSERWTSLDKFELFATIKGRSWDKGVRVYQNMASVVALRNALTHFKPEFTNEAMEHERLSRKLRGFLTMGGIAGDPLLFPREWICHKSTKKIVDSTVDFIKHFESVFDSPHKTDWNAFTSRLSA